MENNEFLSAGDYMHEIKKYRRLLYDWQYGDKPIDYSEDDIVFIKAKHNKLVELVDIIEDFNTTK